MKASDNIYFFIERKIYGIGELINLSFDCKFKNYPISNFPTSPNYEDIHEDMLLDNIDDIETRCICTFSHAPYFFCNGVDMDDILNSLPSSFKMLRAFWKLTFIKIDDEENNALKDIILNRNEDSLYNHTNIYIFNPYIHNTILNKVNILHTLSTKKYSIYLW